jgi:hypothetical protein
MYHKHFHSTKEPDSKLLCFFPAAPKNFQCIMNTVFLSNSFCCPDPSISCAQISRPLFINQEWILDFFFEANFFPTKMVESAPPYLLLFCFSITSCLSTKPLLLLLRSRDPLSLSNSFFSITITIR